MLGATWTLCLEPSFCVLLGSRYQPDLSIIRAMRLQHSKPQGIASRMKPSCLKQGHLQDCTPHTNHLMVLLKSSSFGLRRSIDGSTQKHGGLKAQIDAEHIEVSPERGRALAEQRGAEGMDSRHARILHSWSLHLFS